MIGVGVVNVAEVVLGRVCVFSGTTTLAAPEAVRVVTTSALVLLAFARIALRFHR
jgi:hypothetical protein